jgi:hypothetical protein
MLRATGELIFWSKSMASFARWELSGWLEGVERVFFQALHQLGIDLGKFLGMHFIHWWLCGDLTHIGNGQKCLILPY